MMPVTPTRGSPAVSLLSLMRETQTGRPTCFSSLSLSAGHLSASPLPLPPPLGSGMGVQAWFWDETFSAHYLAFLNAKATTVPCDSAASSVPFGGSFRAVREIKVHDEYKVSTQTLHHLCCGDLSCSTQRLLHLYYCL
uniref:Uncharacterized protein n=1 Tax=Knipowitschia caucasica TaxID=637954 RepID=A0AAV2KVQ3_KNICA